MLIVCPKCFTQYLISDEIKLSKSQKFHCSSCHNYFTQETESSRELMKDVSVEQGSKSPTESASLSAQNSSEKESILSSVSLEKESGKKETDSLFSKPLGLLENERPSQADRLDSIPEEFKPVNPPKKTSLGAALVWLVLAGGICAAAYFQKDFLIEKIDSLIMNQLTAKKTVPETKVTEQKKTGLSAIAQPVQKQVDAIIPSPIQEASRISDSSVPIGMPSISEPISESGVSTEKAVQITPAASVNSENAVLGTPIAGGDVVAKDVVKVQDISYVMAPNEVGVERLAIQGTLANTDLREVTLPELKAVVYDEQDAVVARKRITIPQKKLSGNSTLSFATAVVPAPATVTRVEVVFDE